MAVYVPDLSSLNEMEKLLSQSDNPVLKQVYKDQQKAFKDLRTRFQEFEAAFQPPKQQGISVSAPSSSRGGSNLFTSQGPALFNPTPLGVQGNRRGLLGS
jgi:hypothetical protein